MTGTPENTEGLPMYPKIEPMDLSDLDRITDLKYERVAELPDSDVRYFVLFRFDGVSQYQYFTITKEYESDPAPSLEYFFSTMLLSKYKSKNEAANDK